MTQTAKDPAAIAVAPGHGSTNPRKDMNVNVKTNTTAAAVTASTEKPSISDLESPIHDARRMASILCSMLEHKFSSSSDGPSYHLTNTETEDLLFAAYHTELLLGAVLAKWEEVA